jgi:hypothetical protein
MIRCMGGESTHPEHRGIKTVPEVPWSHPFIERLIGTIRRECLDRLLFWTAADLEAKLDEFSRYYNEHRTHRGLNGRLPNSGRREPISLASYRWQKHCRGLSNADCRMIVRIRQRHVPLTDDIAGNGDQRGTCGSSVVAVDVELDYVVRVGAKRMGGDIIRVTGDVPLERQEQIEISRHAA